MMMCPASALASESVPLARLQPFAVTAGNVVVNFVEWVKLNPQLGAQRPSVLLAHVAGLSPVHGNGSCDGFVISPFHEIQVE